jgi:predicted small secreted protein
MLTTKQKKKIVSSVFSPNIESVDSWICKLCSTDTKQAEYRQVQGSGIGNLVNHALRSHGKECKEFMTD